MPRRGKVPAVGAAGNIGRYYTRWYGHSGPKPWQKEGPSIYRRFIKRRRAKLDRLAARQDPECPDYRNRYRGYDD